MMKHTLLAIVMVTMLGSAGNVAADDSKLLEGLVARLEALQSEVLALKGLQSKVTALEAEMETKQDAMDCLYQVGNGLYVDGCNLHVQDGSGDSGQLPVGMQPVSTMPNGLGNLIVGYNEDHPWGSEKTGSHNVIVGAHHTYTNRSGLVTGDSNTIKGFGAAVIGGIYNVASAHASSVSGGQGNIASWHASSVSGGVNNTASGSSSLVSGGAFNRASGSLSTVSGGYGNKASGYASTVSGGVDNVADTSYQTLP